MWGILNSLNRKMVCWCSRLKRMIGYYSGGDQGIPFEAEFSDKKFVSYLYTEILRNAIQNSGFVVFSEPNSVAILLVKKLVRRQLRLGVISTGSIRQMERCGVQRFRSLSEAAESREAIQAIVITSPVSKVIHEVFDEVKKTSALNEALVIYRVRGSETYPLLNQYDQLRELGILGSHVYVSSTFDDGLLDDIYKWSLTMVRRKCQVRDAYDLFQSLRNIGEIKGDVIEFGSYEGHSGILIAEFIRRTKLDKKLYLCDTFDKFPDEAYGVDKPWGGTHPVDFSRVTRLFEPYEFVCLVRGDFEKTLEQISSDKFSLAVVDCDTYRSTHFVADFVYPKMSPGGIIFFEDYGHHSLLGARKAVDEFLADKQGDTISWFSFFSGVRLVVKLV